mmetsp:Transcript_107291/g.212985  ORF Transcript_107291/g.212985 Transcript_107291/m.212985 type:complete len:245 (+) Transcript_107291:762-1496(+)
MSHTPQAIFCKCFARKFFQYQSHGPGSQCPQMSTPNPGRFGLQPQQAARPQWPRRYQAPPATPGSGAQQADLSFLSPKFLLGPASRAPCHHHIHAPRCTTSQHLSESFSEATRKPPATQNHRSHGFHASTRRLALSPACPGATLAQIASAPSAAGLFREVDCVCHPRTPARRLFQEAASPPPHYATVPEAGGPAPPMFSPNAPYLGHAPGQRTVHAFASSSRSGLHHGVLAKPPPYQRAPYWSL